MGKRRYAHVHDITIKVDDRILGSMSLNGEFAEFPHSALYFRDKDKDKDKNKGERRGLFVVTGIRRETRVKRLIPLASLQTAPRAALNQAHDGLHAHGLLRGAEA